MELINLELKFATKKLNPQINLPFNFCIQKYFFHDNPTWNINYSALVFQLGTRSTYSMVKSSRQKIESELKNLKLKHFMWN